MQRLAIQGAAGSSFPARIAGPHLLLHDSFFIIAGWAAWSPIARVQRGPSEIPMKGVGSLCLAKLDCAVVAGHAPITFLRFILPARVGLVGSLLDVALETPRCLETV